MDTLPSAATVGSVGADVGEGAGVDIGAGSAACTGAGFGTTLGADARFSKCRSVVCNDPSISGVSASTTAVTTGNPLTYVPLVLPKSSMDHRPSAIGVAER